MQRRYTLLILISVFIVVCDAATCWFLFHEYGLPFSVTIADAHTAVVHPTGGLALPVGIEPGDRIDLAALNRPARIAISITNLEGQLPRARTYQLAIQRGVQPTVIPVTTVDWGTSRSLRFSQWVYFVFYVLMGCLALLALWRGRDRASRNTKPDERPGRLKLISTVDRKTGLITKRRFRSSDFGTYRRHYIGT